jgi:hypothetical protein
MDDEAIKEAGDQESGAEGGKLLTLCELDQGGPLDLPKKA